MTDAEVALDGTNIQSVVPLYMSVFNDPPWNDGWTAEAAAERLHAFAAFPRFHGIAIFRSEAAIAFALGWGERWTTGWHFHLKEMCVAAGQQDQQIGSRLLASVETRLAAAGFEGIYLQTGGNVPARGFYEAKGFRDLRLVSLSKRLAT
ncbi:MAG: GNAT family N-acetyltransferase [Pseudomonadota bacterium]